jgi:hypothetical protein
MCLRSTEPPLLPNPCYRLAFLSVVGYNHLLCRPFVSFVECFFVWLVCRVFYFFLKRWKFFKNNFSFGSALQALLKTLVVLWLVRFLIVLAKCVGLYVVKFFNYILCCYNISKTYYTFNYR